jgi:hypothetical protein
MIDLSIVLERFSGAATLHLPGPPSGTVKGGSIVKDSGRFKRWAQAEQRALAKELRGGMWHVSRMEQQVADLRWALAEGTVAVAGKGGGRVDISGIAMRARERRPIYLEITRPRARRGQAQWIDVLQTIGGKAKATGGLTLRVQIEPVTRKRPASRGS